MGLFDDLFGTDNKKKQQKFDLFSLKSDKKGNSIYTEKDLKGYELEDWQKEEVKKGNYGPWNFEEEELEEDDYYNEDD